MLLREKMFRTGWVGGGVFEFAAGAMVTMASSACGEIVKVVGVLLGGMVKRIGFCPLNRIR